MFNPFMMNGLSHHYQLGESTVIWGESGVILNFYFIFRCASRITPDGMPRFAHLGLYFLPLSYKRDARLKRVKLLTSSENLFVLSMKILGLPLFSFGSNS